MSSICASSAFGCVICSTFRIRASDLDNYDFNFLKINVTYGYIWLWLAPCAKVNVLTVNTCGIAIQNVLILLLHTMITLYSRMMRSRHSFLMSLS